MKRYCKNILTVLLLTGLGFMSYTPVVQAKGEPTATVTKINKVALQLTGASHTKDATLMLNKEVLQGELPIVMKVGRFGSYEVSVKALQTAEALYLPLEVLKNNSLYVFKEVKPKQSYVDVEVPYVEINIKKPRLRMEQGKVTEKNEFLRQNKESEPLFPALESYRPYGTIKVPLYWYGGLPYVALRNGTSHVGLKASVENGTVQVRTELPDKKGDKVGKREVTLPIAMYFDPLTSAENTYQKIPDFQGTNIMAPSFFALAPEGIIMDGEATFKYVARYKTAGYQVWPLITNQFDADLTHRILQNSARWETYAQELILYSRVYGFEGYNFDFEDIHLEDKEKLVAFIQYLSERLQAEGLRTSMDVTGYSQSPNWSLVYDRKALSQGLDYLVLMAYDEVWRGSKVAGPVASYPWVETSVDKLVKEVEPSKILLGVPFYMRLWREPVENGHDKAKSMTLSMIGAEKFMKEHQNKVIWDEQRRVPYLEWIEANTKEDTTPVRKKIWFETEQTLQEKLALAHKYKLAGFAAWRKGFEPEESRMYLYEVIQELWQAPGVVKNQELQKNQGDSSKQN